MDIEILSNQTFFNFHRLIQDDLGHDSSQIASFFTTSQEWEKEREFTLFDITDGENNLTIPMDKAILKNYIWSRTKDFYMFSIFSMKGVCLVELIDKQAEVKYSDYPAVI